MVYPGEPGRTSAYQELILTGSGGTVYLPLALPEAHARGAPARRRSVAADLSGTFSSAEGNLQDVPRRVHAFARGGGFARKPPEFDQAVEWDGFAESENACTRYGYICPSGEQVDGGYNPVWGTVWKILEFSGDLFIIAENDIGYFVNGLGVGPIGLYQLPGDKFFDAEVWGGQLRVAVQCTHVGAGAGQHHSFVSIAPSGSGGAPYTITHPDMTYAAGAPPQASLLAVAFWSYQGVADYRLVAKTGPDQIQWMITPEGDPYDPLNWGPPVHIGPTSEAIQELISSHTTVWVVKNDGLYAVKDENASAGGENLTPHWANEQVPGGGNGMYWGNKLVVYRGGRLALVDVNSWEVENQPTAISIEAGRPTQSTGMNAIYYTALGADRDWLVAGMKNTADNAYILYGTPRERESGIAGTTHFDWFPEIGPIVGAQVQYVYVFTPADGTADGGRPTLWVGYFQGSVNKLMRIDLVKGGNPLADPEHRYNTLASLTFTDEAWTSRMAQKGALVGAVAVRNTGSGRRVDVEVVGGAGSAFTGTPTFSVATALESYHQSLYPTINQTPTVRTKMTLISTATVPVVVDEWELRAHLGWPLRRRGAWTVELSDLARGDLADRTRDPDAAEAMLLRWAELAETITAQQPDGLTKHVVIDNLLPYEEQDRSDDNERTQMIKIQYTQID